MNTYTHTHPYERKIKMSAVSDSFCMLSKLASPDVILILNDLNNRKPFHFQIGVNTYRASSNSTKANGGPRRFFKSTKVTLPNLWNKSWMSFVRISGGKLPT